MKYTGIINRDISAMVARTGHFDRIVVSDAGFPIPRSAAEIPRRRCNRRSAQSRADA